MGLSPGDPILLVLEGDQVRMLTPRAAIRRAQQLVGPYVAGGPSMADELLAERREEARLEGGRASSTAR
jgi:hypothetical protein